MIFSLLWVGHEHRVDFSHILTLQGYLIYCAVVAAVYGERTIVAQVG